MAASVDWVLTMALVDLVVPAVPVVAMAVKRVQIMEPIRQRTYRRVMIPTTAHRSQYPRT